MSPKDFIARAFNTRFVECPVCHRKKKIKCPEHRVDHSRCHTCQGKEEIDCQKCGGSGSVEAEAH